MKTTNTNTAMTIPVADSAYTFTPAAVIILGRSYTAKYSISKKGGTVYAFTVVDGISTRLKIAAGDASYHAAFDAATQAASVPAATTQPAAVPGAVPAPVADPAATTQPAAAQPAKKRAVKKAAPAEAAAAPAAQPAATAQPAAQPAKKRAVKKAAAAPAAQPAATAQAAAPAPATTAEGYEIIAQGSGWRIIADTTLDRTRLIFDAEPSPSQVATVELHRFYYSPTQHSYNKHLTQKARKAAAALAAALNAIT